MKKKDKNFIEAILFSATEPLDVATIKSKTKRGTDVLKILYDLQKDYSERGINLINLAGKWSFRTAEDLSNKLKKEIIVQKKLSKAAIETLAIIAYHQPVTRSEIEQIRGVAFGSNTIEILMELDWVRPAGRKNIPGKPIQYVTTENFLNHFNIQKLSDLPTIDELGTAGLIDTSAVNSSIFGTSKFFSEQSSKTKEDIYSDIETVIDDNQKLTE